MVLFFHRCCEGDREQAGSCLLHWNKLFAVHIIQPCQSQWSVNWSMVIAVKEVTGLMGASCVNGGFLTPDQVHCVQCTVCVSQRKVEENFSRPVFGTQVRISSCPQPTVCVSPKAWTVNGVIYKHEWVSSWKLHQWGCATSRTVDCFTKSWEIFGYHEVDLTEPCPWSIWQLSLECDKR